VRRRAHAHLVALLLAGCGAKSGLERPPPPDADLDAFAPPDVNLDAGRDAPIPDGCTPTDERCDGLDDDCDGVPDDGIVCWTLDGAPLEPVTSTVCANVWYSYDTPAMASANPPTPGVLVSQRAEIVAIETSRSCGGGAIAIIADQVDDGSGGSLRARFAFERDDGGLLSRDEPEECGYERGALRGACVWGWQPCCTDGVMLGPFTGDQCVEIVVDGGRQRFLSLLLMIISKSEAIAPCPPPPLCEWPFCEKPPDEKPDDDEICDVITCPTIGASTDTPWAATPIICC
jgi:hypothetical protein